LLLEAPRAYDRLQWAFGDRPDVVDRAGLLANRLRTFVVARAILGAIAAILDVILLLVLGVPAALLWGLLSFLLSFIPNVGFILSLIPPTILGLLIGGPTLALAVIVGYTVINLAIDYVVQPRFIGGSVDISPVIVTVSIVFWAGVLGGAGALLAVPLTLIVVALADAFDTSRPLSRLLRERVPRAAEQQAEGVAG
jgi:predicted PurR-regulated permease PerM